MLRPDNRGWGATEAPVEDARPDHATSRCPRSGHRWPPSILRPLCPTQRSALASAADTWWRRRGFGLASSLSEMRQYSLFCKNRFIDTFFTSRFSGMVMGWVGMFFFLLLFWGRLPFGPTFWIFKFRSCSISQHDKPQSSLRYGQIFRIILVW